MVRFSKRFAYSGEIKRSKFYTEENLNKIKVAHNNLMKSTKDATSMTGWIPYVSNPEMQTILENMLALYKTWQEQKINLVLVCGIGGSALGARAAIHMTVNKYLSGGMKVVWMDSISPSSDTELLKHLKKNRIKPAAIVISKSGSTLETSINYRFAKAVLIYKYGEKAFSDKLAIVAGENKDNKLRKLAIKMKYHLFDIPDNIGGRFSTLTPAGLLPMIMAGVDVFAIVQGAKDALKDCASSDPLQNTAYDYALHRYVLNKEGHYGVEIIDSYEKKLSALLEQEKQMFAETEGKDGQGILPVPVTYTRDLHSVGQYIQQGTRNFFETTIWVRRSNGNARIPTDENSVDKLDYLDNVWLSEVNRLIHRSVVEAHAKLAQTPVLLLELEKMDAYNYGYYYMWLCLSVAMSASLLEVNPFDQPGVEAYKNLLKEHLTELKQKIEAKENEEDYNQEDEENV